MIRFEENVTVGHVLITTLIKKDVEGRLPVSEPYLWLLSDKQITIMFLPSINQEGEDGHYVLGCGLDHMSRSHHVLGVATGPSQEEMLAKTDVKCSGVGPREVRKLINEDKPGQ